MSRKIHSNVDSGVEMKTFRSEKYPWILHLGCLVLGLYRCSLRKALPFLFKWNTALKAETVQERSHVDFNAIAACNQSLFSWTFLAVPLTSSWRLKYVPQKTPVYPSFKFHPFKPAMKCWRASAAEPLWLPPSFFEGRLCYEANSSSQSASITQ